MPAPIYSQRGRQNFFGPLAPNSLRERAVGLIQRVESANALRVLVVDDDADNIKTLEMVLRRAGHEVATAPDGPHALEVAIEYKPEVVFLDLGLPQMDGCTVAAELRQREETKGAVIVAVTGYGSKEHRKLAANAGFDLYLLKPVDFSQLQAALRTAAEQRITRIALAHPAGQAVNR